MVSEGSRQARVLEIKWGGAMWKIISGLASGDAEIT